MYMLSRSSGGYARVMRNLFDDVCRMGLYDRYLNINGGRIQRLKSRATPREKEKDDLVEQTGEALTPFPGFA